MPAMLRALLSVVLIFVSITVASCRAYRDKVVKIETTPPGAVVLWNGLKVGVSPCELVTPVEGVLDFEVLPPADAEQRLFTQRRTLLWKKLPSSAVLYFDMRLEATEPVKPYEIRHR